MKRTVLALAAAVVLPLAPPAVAADLSGKYTVEGREPSGQTYAGEAAVVKRGDTYHVLWALGDTRAVGTGLMAGDVFAVTYMIRGVPIPGVAIYDVAKDGKLSGRFTMLGAQVVGDERWTPVADEPR